MEHLCEHVGGSHIDPDNMPGREVFKASLEKEGDIESGITLRYTVAIHPLFEELLRESKQVRESFKESLVRTIDMIGASAPAPEINEGQNEGVGSTEA